MKIACLSGKGGAGKTMLAVNLAAAAGHACYVDCDVEEPNGRLFWKPEKIRMQPVTKLLPSFDASKCIGCKKCVSFCRFHALIYIKDKPMMFPEVCHSCGGCQLVCPQQAISETEKEIGTVEIGIRDHVQIITGVLNPGEASGIPVISSAIAQAQEECTILDCPPGSSCSAMSCVNEADYCILVAEPTAFGFHNFQMVYELVTLLNKPCGVVINKSDGNFSPLTEFCRAHHLPILANLPYDSQVASLIASGEIIALHHTVLDGVFLNILNQIGGLLH